MAQRLSVGIVGLPNVGKSTLFNALLKKQAALAANYPFATIEPNVGIVSVPDERLNQLAEITKEEEGMSELPPLKPAMIEFVDIAGLVKGASTGEGLGNKFLSHIREVKVIAHVVRAFEDADVIREGSVGVKEDYETISTELILADLETLSKVNEKTMRLDPILRSGVEKLKRHLDTGLPARTALLDAKETDATKELSLLTNKPEIIVLNVTEGDYSEEKFEKIIAEYSKAFGMEQKNFVVVSAKIESELASLDDDEQKEYLKELGVEKSGLERLIQKAYEKLGLISYLTAGEKEIRAWTIPVGSNAVEAAGEIHTDFMDKFIKAEVVGFEDFIASNGWKNAREKGKAGLQGRDYIMQNGDVVEFKIGR
jgi:GTP-binding protein YchF